MLIFHPPEVCSGLNIQLSGNMLVSAGVAGRSCPFLLAGLNIGEWILSEANFGSHSHVAFKLDTSGLILLFCYLSRYP